MGKDWDDNRGYLPGVDGFLSKYVWGPQEKFKDKAAAMKQRSEDLKEKAKLTERAKQAAKTKIQNVIRGDKCKHEFPTKAEQKKRKGTCVNCGVRVM